MNYISRQHLNDLVNCALGCVHLKNLWLRFDPSESHKPDLVNYAFACPAAVSEFTFIGLDQSGTAYEDISVSFDEGCLSMKDMTLYGARIPAPCDLTLCSNLVVVNLFLCRAVGWDSLSLPNSTEQLFMLDVKGVTSVQCGNNMKYCYLAHCSDLKHVCLSQSTSLKFLECDALPQLERVTPPRNWKPQDNVARFCKPRPEKRRCGGAWCKPLTLFRITAEMSFIERCDPDRIVELLGGDFGGRSSYSRIQGGPGSMSLAEILKIRCKCMKFYQSRDKTNDSLEAGWGLRDAKILLTTDEILDPEWVKIRMKHVNRVQT